MSFTSGLLIFFGVCYLFTGIGMWQAELWVREDEEISSLLYFALAFIILLWPIWFLYVEFTREYKDEE